jgi:hypothetical protein
LPRFAAKSSGACAQRERAEAELTGMVEASSGERQNTALALVRALRPHQWVKNALVFVPLVLGGLLLEFPAWQYACLGFVALCLCRFGELCVQRSLGSRKRSRTLEQA